MERRTILTRGTALIAVAIAGCTDDQDPAPPTDADGSGDGGDGGDGGGEGGGDGGGDTTVDETETTTEETAETTTTTDGGTETTTDGTTTDDTTTDGTTTTTDGGSGEPPASVEVSVGADGARFDPETFEVQVGGTVTWVWEGSGHNVRPASQPDGAAWPGTAGGESTTYNSGHTYEYTFDVAGEYEYYCAPHRAFGMTGSFTVVG